MTDAQIKQTYHTERNRRDTSIENLKGLLIVLVVLGHAILTFLPNWLGFELAFWVIYLFHMPAFAFCSGLVVRNPLASARSAVRTLLPIYLGFSVLHLVMRALLVTDLRLDLKALVAPGLHWYILSLLLWRLGLLVAQRYSARLVLPLLFAASLAVGFVPFINSYFSVSRTIVYAPFFYAGYYLGVHGWQRLRQRIHKPSLISAVAVLFGTALLLMVAWLFATTAGLSTNTVTGKLPYLASVGEQLLQGLAVRALVPVCTAAALIVAAVLIPSGRSLLTRIGSVSLPIYLFHLYFIYPLQRLDNGAEAEWAQPIWVQLLAVISATIIAILLTQSPIAIRLAAEVTRNTTRLYDVVLRGRGSVS